MLKVVCPGCNYQLDEDDLYNHNIGEEEMSKKIECDSCAETFLLKIEDIDGEMEATCESIELEEEIEIEEEDDDE